MPKKVAHLTSHHLDLSGNVRIVEFLKMLVLPGPTSPLPIIFLACQKHDDPHIESYLPTSNLKASQCFTSLPKNPIRSASPTSCASFSWLELSFCTWKKPTKNPGAPHREEDLPVVFWGSNSTHNRHLDIPMICWSRSIGFIGHCC